MSACATLGESRVLTFSLHFELTVILGTTDRNSSEFAPLECSHRNNEILAQVKKEIVERGLASSLVG